MAHTAESFTADERAVLIPSLAAQIHDDYTGIKEFTAEQRDIAANLMDRFMDEGENVLALVMAVPAVDMSHVSRKVAPHRSALVELHTALVNA